MKALSFPRFLLILLPLGLLLSGCASIKPEKPAESYQPVTLRMEPSYISIPLEVKLTSIEKLLNDNLKGLIYEDDDLSDNIAVKAWKKEDFKLALNDNVLSYRIPLKLWVKAGYKVSKFGLSVSDYKEMNAEIALKFKSTITLQPDWTVSTQTVSDGYEWLSAPVVKVGLVEIPVTMIADLLLKANQKTINKQIDQGIKDNLDTRKYMAEAWKMLQKPFKINDEYEVWLKVTPQEIQSTPLKGSAGILRQQLAIKSIAEATVGKEPVSTNPVPLGKLEIKSKLPEGFLVNLSVDLPYTKANALAKTYLNNKAFQQGKYTLLIKDADIYGNNDRMIVHLVVAGSLKGDLYLTAVPVYNDEKQSIQVTEVDFDVKTRNVLAKSGSWLLKSYLLKLIQQNLEFPLAEQLEASRKMLQDNLKEIPLVGNIYLDGKLETLRLGSVQLHPEGITSLVKLGGSLKIYSKE